jgi:hypothetical protein
MTPGAHSAPRFGRRLAPGGIGMGGGQPRAASRRRSCSSSVGRRFDFVDPHGLGSTREDDPVDRIAVAQEVSRGRLPGERLHELVGGPLGRGGVGDVDVDDASPIVHQDHEDEQHLEHHGGDDGHGGAVSAWAARAGATRAWAQRASQQADGRLAMQPGDRHRLGQQSVLFRPRRAQVPLPLHGGILPQTGSRHGYLLVGVGNRNF